MKKFLLLCFVSLFVSQLAMAQFHVNPKIGFNSYQLRSNSELLQFDSKSGFNLGIDVRIGDKVYLAPGVHFYAVGADFEGIFEEGSMDNLSDNIKQQTIRIPLYLGTSLVEVETFKLRAQIGALGSVPINVSDNAFGLEKDDFRDMKFSGAAGVGIDLGHFTLDANFELGFQDIFPLIESVEIRESIWTISAGWIF